MSRMLAFIAAEPLADAVALGPARMADFAALSRLHTDGWGVASTVDATAPIELAAGTDDAPAALAVAGARAARGRISYLRFASAGSAVRPENLQPFVADRTAFAHNGALVPRAAAAALLTPAERGLLAGDTDSEVYFALVRRALDARGDAASAAPETAIAQAVSGVRTLYPTACLNALVLHDGDLFAVHAPGTVPPPLAAFAARGVAAEDLPPGHDADYNVMRVATLPSRARAVSTTGVGGVWHPLPRDTVTRIPPSGPLRPVALPTAD